MEQLGSDRKVLTEFFVPDHISILWISGDRVSGRCQVCPDLVTAPCNQMHFQAWHPVLRQADDRLSRSAWHLVFHRKISAPDWIVRLLADSLLNASLLLLCRERYNGRSFWHCDPAEYPIRTAALLRSFRQARSRRCCSQPVGNRQVKDSISLL